MANLVSGLTYDKKLGEGYFGQVFLGEDKAHGTVAVKVLTPKSEWTADEWQKRKEGFL